MPYLGDLVQHYTKISFLLQSVSPHLSLGGEVFWAGQHRKSGIGYAARYNTDKMVLHSCCMLRLLGFVFLCLCELLGGGY